MTDPDFKKFFLLFFIFVNLRDREKNTSGQMDEWTLRDFFFCFFIFVNLRNEEKNTSGQTDERTLRDFFFVSSFLLI